MSKPFFGVVNDTSNECGMEVGEILADFENDHNEVKAVNSIFSLLSQSEQRVRKEMVEAIKEMVKQKGLHLGYKNNILELLDELMK